MAIKINEAQEEILKELAFENYVEEVKRHCYQQYPYLNKTIQEGDLKDFIRIGIEKAEKYGIDQRGPARFFIDLHVVFGNSFDTDPQYPWIMQEYNKKDDGRSQIEKTDGLCGIVNQYLDNIHGDRFGHIIQAGIHLKGLSIESTKIYQTNFHRQVLELLEQIYPQKYQLTEHQDLVKLIDVGIAKSSEIYGFNEPTQYALFIVLMFLIGHEFYKDPLYAWAVPERIGDDSTFPSQKAIRLETRAKTWLRGAVKNHIDEEGDLYNFRDLIS